MKIIEKLSEDNKKIIKNRFLFHLYLLIGLSILSTLLVYNYFNPISIILLGGIILFYAYLINNLYSDFKDGNQIRYTGKVLKKIVTPDLFGGSKSVEADKYSFEIQYEDGSIENVKIDEHYYHQTLVNDIITIVASEYINTILEYKVESENLKNDTKTDKIVKTSKKQLADDFYPIESFSLSEEETLMYRESEPLLRIIGFILALSTFLVYYYMIFSIPTFIIISLVFSVSWAYLLYRIYNHYNIIKNGVKLVVIGKIMKKETLKNDGKDSCYISISNNSLPNLLYFNVSQSFFDSILTNDIVKVSFIENTTYLISIELFKTSRN